MALYDLLVRHWGRSLECHHLCMVIRGTSLLPNAISRVVGFLCDTHALLVGRRDGTIFVMTTRLDAIIGSFTVDDGGGVWRIATHARACYVAVPMGNGDLRLLDFAAFPPIEVGARLMPLQGRRCVSMAFLPDGDKLVVGCCDGCIRCVSTRGLSTGPMFSVCLSALWDMMVLTDSYDDMMVLKDSCELIACGTGCLHRFRLCNGGLQGSRKLVVSRRDSGGWCLAHLSITNEIAIGCDWQIAMYSVDQHAITRCIDFPGAEAAVWTMSYDCRLHSLFVGRADNGAFLICSVENDSLYHYHENDDYFPATVACSLYLEDLGCFVYGDNRGSVYAVDGGCNEDRPASFSPFYKQKLHTPWKCCLSLEGTDACHVSQLYEIWCLCDVVAQDRCTMWDALASEKVAIA